MLVALVTIAIGVVGIAYPDALTTARRSYFATPARFYTAGVGRVTMGLVLILAASRSRWPLVLRLLGAMMCLQAISATVMGPERARAVLEWETLHATFLRLGAIVALITGGVMALAVTRRQEVR
jgi:hypothetical protein